MAVKMQGKREIVPSSSLGLGDDLMHAKVSEMRSLAECGSAESSDASLSTTVTFKHVRQVDR